MFFTILVILSPKECKSIEKNHQIAVQNNINFPSQTRCFLYCDENDEDDYQLYLMTKNGTVLRSVKGSIYGECICNNIEQFSDCSILHFSKIIYYGIPLVTTKNQL